MARGIVKWFDPKKGFGFVLNEEGMDVFVHYSSIEKEGFRCLRTGQEVEYEEVRAAQGLRGKAVKIVSVPASEDASAPSQ
ncbi:MAG TPA: cold-shock protein [Anaerohalosphaeraceae bacterium]|nr:cold-shock protein [Phycisphaerae bacterium]HOL30677.1 cold-shock protein [Anaerohalosphaeraceae bacterium]HOM76471.1 cold-shock protein [Anaerohalosphaeraceae bacterium]HPC63409.1 cold-shock protein [Anaerohalosphaeraceae bacterium]HPO70701.1 cold-shock protein [Anaerohalosphaeraceae bacterium]